jgi:dihydropyrimidinase
MMPFDLCLTGGEVLLNGIGVKEIDILVSGGKIAGFCQAGGKIDAKEVVRIPGLTVLPGAIDPHVHLGQDITFPKTPEDITKESAAAAAGGITTFLVFFMSPEGYEKTFGNAVKLMDENSLTDFGIHFCACTAEQMASIPAYVKELGVSSFKFFMNFRGEEGKRLGLPGNDDGFLYKLLKITGETESILCPHAENIELIWIFREQARNLNGPPLRIWYECAPPFVEAEALQRVAYLAKIVDVPFYAVHVSSVESLNALTMLRERNTQMYIETCPHYLTHDIDSNIGELGKVNPPLRTSKDREALWEAIKEGTIDAVGSDHVPRVKAAKAGGIWKASAGSPGMETLLPILVSEGHIKRHIPLQRIVDMVSMAPAKIFGLFPQKGIISIGCDADFAIVDLNAKGTIKAEELHSGAGYSIYEGWEVLCRVVHTLVRGRFVVRDGKIQPLWGHGKYYKRHRSGARKEGEYES